MANEENLIPFQDRTESEHREIAIAGGKASGESRRKRKAMREQAELLLSLPFQGMEITKITGKEVEIKNLLDEYAELSGLAPEEIDNQMAMIISMYQTILKGGMGSVNAFNSLRDLVGEKPKEVIEIHSTDETIKQLDNIIESKKGKGGNGKE